jgi:hypothetical protein
LPWWRPWKTRSWSCVHTRCLRWLTRTRSDRCFSMRQRVPCRV